MSNAETDAKLEQIKGKLKETWGKLTNDDIMLYRGHRERFLGKLKEHYSLTKEDAEKKIKAIEEACAVKAKVA